MRSPDATMPPPAAPRRPDAAFRARAAQTRPRPAPDNTPAPTAAATPEARPTTPPAREDLTTPEQKREVQLEEIRRAASNLIQGQYYEYSHMTKEEQDAAKATDPSFGDIVSLWETEHPIEIDYRTHPDRDRKHPEKGINVLEDDPARPLMVRVGENVYTVSHIESFDGENYICWRKGTGDTPQRIEEPIPRNEMVRAQLLAVKESVLNSPRFTDAQKALLRTYYTIAESEADSATELGTPALDTVITQAVENRMPTTGLGRALVNVFLPDLEQTGATRQAIAERQSVRANLFRQMEGKNLIDASTVVEIIKATGVTPQYITQEATEAAAEVQRLQEQLTLDPRNKNLRQQLQTAIDVVNVWKTLKNADFFGENGPIQQFFSRIDQGEMSAAKLQESITALKEERLDTLIGTALTDLRDDKTLTEAERRERAERRQAAMAALGKSGMGVSLLLMLLEWAIGDIGGIKQQ